MDPFEPAILESLATIATCPEDLRRSEERIAKLSGLGPQELLRVVARHKAFTLVDAKRSTAEIPRPVQGLLAVLDEPVRRAREHYELLESEIVWLSTLHELRTAQVALIKGFSTARHYPKKGVRWSRDIDLFIPSWGQTVELLAQLRHHGYAFDERESPWFKSSGPDERRETVYGQVFLVRQVSDGFRRLDIHFGKYSVGYCGSTSIVPSNDYEASAGNLSVLSGTTTLNVMFAHALSDGYVSIKDANDFAAMAVVGTPVEWDRVGAEVKRLALQPQARLLAEFVTANYLNPLVIESAHRLSEAVGVGRSRPWRMHAQDWPLRARVNTFQTARSQAQSRPLAFLPRTVRAYAFYRPRLSIAVQKRSRRRTLYHALLAKSKFLPPLKLRCDACPIMISTGHSALVGHPSLNADGAVWSGTGLAGVQATKIGSRTHLRIADDQFIVSYDQLIVP